MVVLTILKILLIIIASVAGLVIALALIILFVPVRYRIKADKSTPDSALVAKANVSFLLHIFTGFVSYEDELTYGIKIFGIKLGGRHNKSDDEVTQPPVHEDSIEAIDTGDTASIPKEDDFTIDWNDDTAEGSSKEDLSEEVLSEEDEDDGLSDKINDIISKITGKYCDIKEKYDRIRKEIRFWKKMYDDKRNKDAFALIKKEIIRLLKKIAPKKIKGFVHFGFDDPATTGSILMYLAMIYPVLPKKLKIDPSFEDTDIYGAIDVKGRLSLIVPAVSFLKVFFNKDCRRMYRLYKRHSSKQN